VTTITQKEVEIALRKNMKTVKAVKVDKLSVEMVQGGRLYNRNEMNVETV